MSKYSSYLYSLQASCKEAIDTISLSCSNSNDNGLHKEIHHKLGTVVHWIMDCWDRIEKPEIGIDEEDSNYLRAFRCVNNEWKHNKDFIFFHLRISSFEFPLTSPFRFGEPASVEWIQIDKVNNPKFQSQLKYYKLYLEKQDIPKTLEKAQVIIEKYFSIIQS